MAAIYKSFADTFWTESFWLPNNHTWKSLENKDNGIYYPQFHDLYVPFIVAAVLLLIRKIFENVVAYPLGKWYNLREKGYRPPPPDTVLEAAYRQIGKHPSHKDLQALSKRTDKGIRTIERWFRYRRLQGKYTPMKRFQETCWRFLFYFTAFYYGIYILWDKPWLWDTKECWYGHPFQHITSDVYWYYMVEMGFYWALVFSLMTDIKRKDFWEMVIHHVVTIGLMVFSWAGNMVRVGTLVLCCHDAVDYFMELAKVFNYLKYQKTCDALFVVFTVMWFITRLCIFPFKLIYTVGIESPMIIGMYNAMYLYVFLLMALQVLHVIWFYMICRMVYFYVITGKVQKDDRSSSEGEQSEEEENDNYYDETNKQNGVQSLQNGSTTKRDITMGLSGDSAPASS
ncbi:unnamed protein product [Owenia fusiformis]|uniref:Uncharacterized protein n=1 Tax=Owenia fusiformis TaxID=6347 RepID=A0A8J1Y5R8_OWEFU|nr:unnamed protein product [Owenia fusiformis]